MKVFKPNLCTLQGWTYACLCIYGHQGSCPRVSKTQQGFSFRIEHIILDLALEYKITFCCNWFLMCVFYLFSYRANIHSYFLRCTKCSRIRFPFVLLTDMKTHKFYCITYFSIKVSKSFQFDNKIPFRSRAHTYISIFSHSAMSHVTLQYINVHLHIYQCTLYMYM